MKVAFVAFVVYRVTVAVLVALRCWLGHSDRGSLFHRGFGRHAESYSTRPIKSSLHVVFLLIEEVTSSLALLLVFVALARANAQCRLGFIAAHDSRRISQWRRADHVRRRLRWRPNGLIAGRLCDRRSSPSS